MTASWCGVVAAALSWSFGLPLAAPADARARWIFLGCACALFAAAARRSAIRDVGVRRPLAWAAVCAAAIAFLPDAARAAAWILGSGFVLSWASRRGWRRGAALAPLASGATTLGVVLAAQAAVDPLYSGWTARHPVVPGAAGFIAPIFEWLGFDAAAAGDALSIHTLRATHRVLPTWNHLAAWPLLLVFVGGIALLASQAGRRSLVAPVARLAWILAGFAVFRFAAALALFLSALLLVPEESDRMPIGILWFPAVTALTVAPVAWLLARWIPAGRPIAAVAPESAAPGRLRRLAIPALAASLVAGWIAWAHFPESGTRKGGRVLVDEAHSAWERTDEPISTDHYGAGAGYNYAGMYAWLGHWFAMERHLEGPLTPEVLEGADVLVVKTPTEPYSAAEQDAIERFVRRGGGMLCLGEHTNVWGSSSHANALLRRFGLAFRHDSVFDVARKYEQVAWLPRLGRHAVVRDLPFFTFAVSCSIEASAWRVRPLIRSRGLWALPIDWSVGNFYPEVLDSPEATFGTFDQMVSVTAGEGRVVAFADSTVFSNFETFHPGKPELLVAAVDWLDCRDGRSPLPECGLAVAGAAALALAVLVLRGRLPGASVPAAAATALLAAAASLAAVDLARDARVPRPEPRRAPPIVAFDLEHGGHELPVFGFSQDFARCFSVFFQWVLRTGAFPRVDFDATKCLESARQIVVIQPAIEYSPEQQERFARFVEGGGRLLALDSPANARSTAAQLLDRFGLGFSGERARGKSLVDPVSGRTICRSEGGNEHRIGRGSVPVRGGTALLFSEEGEVLAAQAKHGAGLVIACGLAEMFADPSMGGTYSAVPDEERRAIFEVEFALLRGLAAGDALPETSRLESLYRGP